MTNLAAPVLDTSLNLSLPTIPNTITSTANTGITITALVGALITDADGDLGAIAITQVNNASGTWQYSLNGGSSWVNLTNVSASNAVVLGTTPLYAPGVSGNPSPSAQRWLSFSQFTPASPLNPGGIETPANAGITLDTSLTGNPNGTYAGYSNYSVDFLTRQYTLKNAAFPALDPNRGFRLSFEAQILNNTFTNNDRAVFSLVLVMADGQQALELGFQETGAGQGRIFAQSDDVTPNPGGQPNVLFTSAEEVSFDTTDLARYTLNVSGNTYSLRANGAEILTGPLRNYSSFSPDPIFGFTPPNPYTVPNLLFLGDNSVSAGGSFTLGDVSLQTETRLRFVPTPGVGGSSSFSFRAWDGSDGSAPGSRVNTLTNGGTTPFSTALETANILVTNPPPAVYNFSQASYQALEGNQARVLNTVVLTRTGNTAIASTVTVALTPSLPNPTDATDYRPRAVALSFAPGETRKVIPISILGDRRFEASERIALSLTNLSANSRRGFRPTATLTLLNDDPLIGNNANNVLVGNNENNTISGLLGNDSLVGLGGNDVMAGGGGRDFLNGGLGADIQFGQAGGDRFLYQGVNVVAAHRNSLVTAPDWIRDFSFGQGDRIQLDYDNRFNTPNRPIALFNAGVKAGASLAAATLAAFADKNRIAAGRQALGAREAVFFFWRNRTYLAVNDTLAGFNPNQDLVIQMTGLQFRPGDATATVLNPINYFV